MILAWYWVRLLFLHVRRVESTTQLLKMKTEKTRTRNRPLYYPRIDLLQARNENQSLWFVLAGLISSHHSLSWCSSRIHSFRASAWHLTLFSPFSYTGLYRSWRIIQKSIYLSNLPVDSVSVCIESPSEWKHQGTNQSDRRSNNRSLLHD